MQRSADVAAARTGVAPSPVRTAISKEGVKETEARAVARKDLKSKAAALIAESSEGEEEKDEAELMDVSAAVPGLGFPDAALAAAVVDLTADRDL